MMNIETTDIPDDDIPDVIGVEYPCEQCGREAGPYGGRGRKPRFCSDHKKQSSQPKASAKNTNLARNAAQTLGGYNALLALGTNMLQLPRTANAINNGNDIFIPMAEQALATDPLLAAKIATNGAMPAWIHLCAAYCLFAVGVTPVLKNELQAKKTK